MTEVQEFFHEFFLRELPPAHVGFSLPNGSRRLLWTNDPIGDGADPRDIEEGWTSITVDVTITLEGECRWRTMALNHIDDSDRAPSYWFEVFDYGDIFRDREPIDLLPYFFLKEEGIQT